MPVTVSVPAVFTRLTSPLPVLVALKLVTVLAVPSPVPAAELVVSSAPLIVPAPASLIAPAVAVRLTSPVVDTLRGLLLGTPIGGSSVVLAVAWCAALSLVGYLWARAIYNRGPVR